MFCQHKHVLVAVIAIISVVLIGAAAQVTQDEFNQLEDRVQSLEKRVEWLENGTQSNQRANPDRDKFCRLWKWKGTDHGGLIKLKKDGTAIKDGTAKRAWVMNRRGYPTVKFESGDLIVTGIKSRNPVVLTAVFKENSGEKKSGYLKLLD